MNAQLDTIYLWIRNRKITRQNLVIFYVYGDIQVFPRALEIIRQNLW